MNTRDRTHRLGTFVLTLALLGSGIGSAMAQGEDSANLPGPLREVGFEQRLGEELPLDTVFTNEAGDQVRLGDYFGERPVVLTLVYYECPMLCIMVLDGLATSLDILTFEPGDQYEVVVLSFDPREDHVLATSKKRQFLQQLGREGAGEGIHFLTGTQESIDAVTDAVGFTYTYDEENDEFAHAAGLTVATAEGRISRYLFGIEYAPKDLRLALVESAQNKIGSAVDQLLLFCYNYDPTTGRYGAATMRLVQAGGAVTILAIVLFVVLSRRRDQRLAHASNQDSTQS